MNVPLQAEEAVDFQQQIRPILAEHCFQCHGPDEGARQAGLRLDRREMALQRTESGSHPIVPGKPDASEMVLRITTGDPDLLMPPPDQKNPLSVEQRQLVELWIQQGAPFTQHWSFVAPKRSEVPRVSLQARRLRNPIDNFVVARLAQEGLSLAPIASPYVLCRRIHLDVVGLPPTPQEVDAFVQSFEIDARSAIDGLVDRLLKSEHFGEKWARHWLDVARYADTNGYEKDNRRDQWAWRDWVVRSLNADLPYNQFVIQQVAGDLLPDATQDHFVATGFLRNGMINEEGAIVPEQFRMDGMFDRMDCIGKAVLGLSIQCAQCHSHKFDPISQDEYYGMFAFLNNACEAQSGVFTGDQRQKISDIHARVQTLEERVRSDKSDWQSQLAAWVKHEVASAPKWSVLDTYDQTWIGGLNHPDELSDHSIMVLGHPTASGDMYVLADADFQGVTGLRFEALTHGDLPHGGPGRSSERGHFSVTELTVESKKPGSGKWEPVALGSATADFSEKDQPLTDKENENRRVGPVSYLVDGKNETAWRADRGPGRRNTDSVAVIQFAKPMDLPPKSTLKISLKATHNKSGHPRDVIQLGRMRFAVTKSPGPTAADYDHAATLAMSRSEETRIDADRSAIFRAWRKSQAELNPINAEIAAIEAEYPVPTTSVLHYLPRRVDDPRPTFLLDRGVWDRPKHKVGPHVPAVLHAMSQEGTTPRLAFARWLVARESPLAARVQVNRTWQAIFGAGLVRTPEDFGTRAPQPVHLGLLDWLSVEFMEQGWSMKQLVRTIVTSATYQQSSKITPVLLEKDPQNMLLARAPRFRADAEVIRDIALTVSGLLNTQLGGPSVYPPVPETVLADTFVRPDYWKPETGEGGYRRGLYVFRKRNMPDPVLTNFDAPNADFACAQRVRSNTPLAALVSLNEPIFMEAARGLARRILREGGPSDVERTDYAYRLCTSRPAKPAELAAVLRLLQNRRVKLAEGWLSINEIATGDPAVAPEIPENTTPQDAAAWTIVARVLLNLDETLSKN